MKALAVFSALAMAIGAYAAKVPSEAIGTVGVGTDWEAKVYAAYDERQSFPFQGCLAPKDREAYVQALQDKDSRERLRQDFDGIVQPSDSPFRKLLAHTADADTALKTEINRAQLDTLNGPRTAYWPGVSWRDHGKSGEVGFEPCSDRSFRIERKLTRVLRTQTVDQLVQTTEPLTISGQISPVTLTIYSVQISETAPGEAPGTVQLLQNGRKNYCFKARDAQGTALTSFAAYTPASDGYQIRFRKLTRLLKTDQALVKALCPFYQYAPNLTNHNLPTAQSEAYSEHFSARIEQRELEIQVGLCGKEQEPYSTDQMEYRYLIEH